MRFGDWGESRSITAAHGDEATANNIASAHMYESCRQSGLKTSDDCARQPTGAGAHLEQRHQMLDFEYEAARHSCRHAKMRLKQH